MTTRWVKRAVVLTCAGILVCSLPAVGGVALAAPVNKNVKAQEKVWGKVFLKAGPEISLSYDWEGEVLEAKGMNRDGKDLLEGAASLAGKDCDTAVRILVKRMDDKGWFDKNNAERTKDMVIESERNSVYPEAGFMDEIRKEAQEVIDRRNIELHVTVKDNGYLAEGNYIGREEAKKIALRELGLKAENLTYVECDLENGIYELEFLVNGVKLEVNVNADSGAVVKVDWDDDRDDDDRYDDDWDDDGYDNDRDDDDRYDDQDDDDRYDDDQDGDDD